MLEYIPGIIMFVVPLSIVFIILLRSYKNSRRTGKWFILKGEKTKWWQVALAVIFFIFSVCIISLTPSIIEEVNKIIIPIEFNPWGWYT